MHITNLFGLPAHPLLVHAPIVLIPLCGLGTIAMALNRGVLRRYGWLVAALTVVAGLSTQLAISSGQGLLEKVRRTAALDQHVNMAESIRPLVLVLFFAELGLLWFDWQHQRGQRDRAAGGATGSADGPGETATGATVAGQPRRALRLSVSVLAIVLAVGTNVRLVQIGHSGAKATWENTRLVSQSTH